MSESFDNWVLFQKTSYTARWGFPIKLTRT
jgi:hypothetical protein